MMIGRFLFWGSLLALAYIYVGYPLILEFLARWFPRPVHKQPLSASVDVLIAVYNEERVIAQKLQNLLSLDGADKIRQILVGSDGSTDQTVECARSVKDPRVRILVFPQRRGKSAVLNDLMRECVSDIALMTDARQEIDRNALMALLENFSDPLVGVVSGELVFRSTNRNATAAGMDTYWNYEKRIRKAEAAFHSVPGATGALYAIRRRLLKPIPPETLLDDVVIPMQAIIEGYRCVFEPRAVVWDEPSVSPEQEAIRKRRTLAGNMQLVALFPEWLNPQKNPIAWQFVSHKLARLLAPLFLALCLAGSLMLAREPFYLWASIVQLALPAISYLAFKRKDKMNQAFPLRAVCLFYTMNGLILRAFWDFVRKQTRPAWERA